MSGKSVAKLTFACFLSSCYYSPGPIIVIIPAGPPAGSSDAQDIARDMRVQELGNPPAVKPEDEKLNPATEEKPPEKRPIKPPVTVRPSETVLSETSRGLGVPVKVHNAPIGELEVAISKDTDNIVIASNSGLSFSTDRGKTFINSNHGVPLEDPSLARGVSGHFYLSVNGEATEATGCTTAVSQSTNKGENFNLRGFSAQCLFLGPICFPDQAHIAADSATATAAGNDQLYAVWRHWNPSKPFANCREIDQGFVTALISCSQDNGVNWTPGDPIPGAGDFPRVAVGLDGSVYVVRIIGTTIRLNRFTSCANGLIPELNVVVASLNGTVSCPVPGLDRCNDGNTLSSPTVAPDTKDANHLFVAFAEKDMTGGERIVITESRNRGGTFPRRTTVSGTTSARRFMPWACSTNGDAWVGWYDRRAATEANNDLTDYFIGSAKSTSAASAALTPGTTRNLTNNPDPQCASGWLSSPRNAADSDSCSIQPQLAGTCSSSFSRRCDFNDLNPQNRCPTGEICQTGGGTPKYGDYNGIACMGNYVFAAWVSATSPAGLTPASGGIRVFASTELVGTPKPAAPRNLGVGR